MLDFSFLSIRDIWMLGTVALCALFLLDDLFVDALALFQDLKPNRLKDEDWKQMNSLPQKKIAIIVANWHEADVLERMVAGNIHNIDYKNYEFILGVYPNDQDTIAAARRAEKRFRNVTVVVNTRNGPTSKGQMLNLLASYVENHNKTLPDKAFDIVLMHDSEDVIHRYSLKLINYRAEKYDFIQVPVFSLPTPLRRLTAGVYIDEFIESHTKDLLVREHYNAGIPSAGVGTALTWSAVKQILELQDGEFLNEKTLTEDYHLGLTCHDLGLREHFSCDYYVDEKTGLSEYIATREYFPQKFRQSVRQKTRWALGISLQGFEELRWNVKSFFQGYFLWRDRKGLISAPLFTSAFIFTVYYLMTYFLEGRWPRLDYSPYALVFEIVMWANLLFSICRIIQRCYLVSTVYGVRVASLVPVRWVLSNFINTFSTYRAMGKWATSKVSGELPGWSKTEHVIPTGFGLENMSMIETEHLDILPDADVDENAQTVNTEPTDRGTNG